MYIQIKKIAEKRVKNPKSGVYKTFVWRGCNNKGKYDICQGYWFKADEIIHEPKYRYNIYLSESHRVDGKVTKTSKFLIGISYWEIITDWVDELIGERIENYLFTKYVKEHENIDLADYEEAIRKERDDYEKNKLQERLLNDNLEKIRKEYNNNDECTADYDKLHDMVFDKFQVIIDTCQNDYEQSEENKYEQRNKKRKRQMEEFIKKEKEYRKRKKDWTELHELKDENLYDKFYTKDFKLKSMSKETHNLFKKILSDDCEREKRRQQQEREQQKQWQDAYRNYDFSSFGLGASHFDDKDKLMATEVIQAGFKKMAFKYHPDKGGTTKTMQQLNDIKDALLKLI